MPHSYVEIEQRSRAKGLRRRMTDAERKLWCAIRANRRCGVQFRRQVPLGPYILDFASHSVRIVIEVDGGQHFTHQGLAPDAKRDEWLTSQGYQVMRFTNIEVLNNLEGVLSQLTEAISASTPLPDPPPQGGRGSGLGGSR